MNEVFTLWLGKTNHVSRKCMRSWKQLGYKVIVYTNIDHHDHFLDKYEIRDYRSILNLPITELLPFSDLFRYRRLFREGGIWIDADMYLLKRLPEDDIIISSERCCKTGAFKRAIDHIPNIGVLKFPKNDPLIGATIRKIESSRAKNNKIIKNMQVFQNLILKKYVEYQQFVALPEEYCPVNWSNCKDIYYSTEFKSKYGKDVNQIDEILDESIGVHLWGNFTINKHKIDFGRVENGSLFSMLK